jgi:hypothetical protein
MDRSNDIVHAIKRRMWATAYIKKYGHLRSLRAYHAAFGYLRGN